MGEDVLSSVEECTNWCSYNPDCCVFEYSPSTKKCHMTSCIMHYIVYPSIVVSFKESSF